MEKKDILFLRKIGILILCLTFSLTFLFLNKTASYSRYERVQFQSAGATLYANLYYPSKTLDFQNNRPLIIYCHGIGSQRDFDLRIPIELTKRGFYLAALDYQGHGESGGSINNMVPILNIPAIAQDCSMLLDKLETMPFYSNVNTSQIGLIGHSLGGMVVLMNQALDDRFTATVAWAPLVDFDPALLGITNPDFIDYIPANILDMNNSDNLLIIMHVNDEVLDFTENALQAQSLTNCTVIPVTGALLGGGHQLFSDGVIIESINWFEAHFFNSETINGPIFISFMVNYIFLFLSLGILIAIVLTLTSYSSKYFSLEEKEEKPTKLEKKRSFKKVKQGIKLIKIGIYSGAFVINWVLFEYFFGLQGIFIASLLITLIYLAAILGRRYRNLKKREEISTIKEFIISKLQIKHFFYSMFFTIYFIAILILFSISYPSNALPPSPFLDVAFIVIIIFLIASIALSCFFGYILFYIHKKQHIQLEFKLNLRNIKIQNKRFVRVFLYSLACSCYFIIIYLVFSISYPFAFMWPSNYINLVLTVIAFPILLSMELLYRKLIYPNLSFLNERAKRRVIIVIAVIIQISLMILTQTWSFFPSVLFTYFMFLFVIIQNTLIYEHTHNFAAVVLSSFNIIQLFFAAVISNALGIGSALQSFVSL
ncbi:MAG: alpha/beta fold hydrolase [Promethearchaeota archaeon]|nr:MAG: alpha/beta fold hydrolase [Candidatus Lokiarchaeota archaeon]